MKYINGICSLCDRNTEVRHLSIYAFGSEGIWVCEKCSRMIAQIVCTLASIIKSRIYWAVHKEKATKRD